MANPATSALPETNLGNVRKATAEESESVRDPIATILYAHFLHICFILTHFVMNKMTQIRSIAFTLCAACKSIQVVSSSSFVQPFLPIPE